MLKKLSSWIYLRSVSKREDLDIFLDGYTQHDENGKLSVFQYHRLAMKQIEAILEIIDREVVKSYQFGLKISRDHVLKEKAVALFFLDSLGGPCTIQGNYEFENTMKAFSEMMHEAMEEESLSYFKKLKEEGLMPNMYNCHLESVKSTLLQAVYNKKLPYMQNLY